MFGASVGEVVGGSVGLKVGPLLGRPVRTGNVGSTLGTGPALEALGLTLPTCFEG